VHSIWVFVLLPFSTGSFCFHSGQAVLYRHVARSTLSTVLLSQLRGQSQQFFLHPMTLTMEHLLFVIALRTRSLIFSFNSYQRQAFPLGDTLDDSALLPSIALAHWELQPIQQMERLFHCENKYDTQRNPISLSTHMPIFLYTATRRQLALWYNLFCRCPRLTAPHTGDNLFLKM